MRDSKVILVLGGGVGGIATARELRRRLARHHRVVLVDRERRHIFPPSLPWIAVGLREADAVGRPLARLARKGIEVVHGEVESIDPVRRAAVVSGREIVADFVVVSLGADLAPEVVPGLESAGHNLYTLAGAESLRASLTALEAGRLVVLTATPAYKCPAAPYEVALLIDAHLQRRRRRPAVELELWAAESAPMPVAGAQMSEAVSGLLAARDIPYHPGRQLQAVDVPTRTLQFADGDERTYDVLAYVPPHRAPQVVRESPLAGESGWVSVDRNTFATAYAGVFAIGDVVTIPLALGKPLPKAGVFAHGAAHVVARNIAAQIAGRPETHRFGGYGECFIETGRGRAGFGGGDFYAEPRPEIAMRAPSRRWHFGKVLFEKLWLNFEV